MIPGIVAGGMIGEVPPSVSFVSATGTAFASGATSINSPASPSGILSGDGLFAILFGRSALTPPSGWTLVDSQINIGVVTQTLYVYRKNSVGPSDSSTAFTWSQSASGSMGLGYVVVRSTNGVVNVAQSDSAETDRVPATYPHSVDVPSLTADENGELFLIAASCEVATATPGIDTWTAPNGATIRSPNAQSSNRLAFCTQTRNAGQSNAASMAYATNAGGSGNNYYSTITVRLSAL